VAGSGPNGIPCLQRSGGVGPSSCGKCSFSLEVHLTPNPIRKVLSTIRMHHVQALLMGGQACVFYGAAEFSRDIDLAIPGEKDNLLSIQGAMDELQAKVIALPPFERSYLERGHAVHFRCNHPEAQHIRVDLMTHLRGVDMFSDLWERRTAIETAEGETIDLMGLPDLVKAKKTQRDKDWPMIRRLVEAHYAEFRFSPTPERRRFWLNELRSPILLLEELAAGPAIESELSPARMWLATGSAWPEDEIALKLRDEEFAERNADKLYWDPLKRELETLRRSSWP